MEHHLIIIISILLLFIGILGTFLPVLPGLILSLAGFLLYKFGTNTELSLIYVWIFTALIILSTILNYTIPARINRKYGGSKWGSWGSIIGTILGILFIPVPFGFLIGMFLGVFIGELFHDFNDRRKAINSVKGALIGFIYGTGFSFVVGVAMLLVVLYDIIF